MTDTVTIIVTVVVIASMFAFVWWLYYISPKEPDHFGASNLGGG